MEIVNVEQINAVHLRITADSGIKMELEQYFRFQPNNYQFSPAFKNRVWDGWIRIFNAMKPILYVGLFHKLKKVSSSISSLIDPSITNIEIIKDESNNNYSVHDLPYPNSDDSSSSGMREPDDDEYERW